MKFKMTYNTFLNICNPVKAPQSFSERKDYNETALKLRISGCALLLAACLLLAAYFV